MLDTGAAYIRGLTVYDHRWQVFCDEGFQQPAQSYCRKMTHTACCWKKCWNSKYMLLFPYNSSAHNRLNLLPATEMSSITTSNVGDSQAVFLDFFSKVLAINFNSCIFHHFSTLISHGYLELTPAYLYHGCWWSGGRLKKHLWALNLRALEPKHLNKMHIFQCMGKTFCMKFHRNHLKFHIKHLTHALKETVFIQSWNFKSSQI